MFYGRLFQTAKRYLSVNANKSTKFVRSLLNSPQLNARLRTFTSKGEQLRWSSARWTGVLVGAVGGSAFIVVCIYSIREQPALLEGKLKKGKQKIVVLGSGWGAVSFLKNLEPGVFDVSVVSPSNYFVFTPFLPSVTVGTVEARSICEPIRRIICKRHKEKSRFIEAECYDVDINKKKVYCRDVSGVIGETVEFELDYDILVIAVGSETNTYNIKGVKEHTHYLKDIFDVQKIRKNIVDSLETAAYPGQSEDEKKRLLHFVVVGGGPSGVEFAAELRDFVKQELRKLYPDLEDYISVSLIDGLNKILSTYDAAISDFVEKKFSSDQITLIKNTFVTDVEKDRLQIMDARTKEKRMIPYGMCVWAAGIAPTPFTKTLIQKIPEQTNRMALVTDAFLQVKNAPCVFAIGDCATMDATKVRTDVDTLFAMADINKDGGLSLEEFSAIMDNVRRKYPQWTLHFSKAFQKSVQGAFQAADKDKDNQLSIEEFRTFLQQVDDGLKVLPATAQVAAQEGKYLGKMINTFRDVVDLATNGQTLYDFGVDPFEYHHLGSFAYVGDNKAVLELPLVGSFMGLATMWLWRASYTSECVGYRMKTLVLFDWIKSSIFGRDTSRL